MRKAVLYYVAEPKEAGESPKMYWIKNHIWSTLREVAHIFESKEEVDKVQSQFDFDTQLEYLEA